MTASKTFTENSTRSGTVADNLEAGDDSKSEGGAELTLRQAAEKLNTLIGESDPDTSLTQVEHLLQSVEAIRRDVRVNRTTTTPFTVPTTASTPLAAE